MAKANKKIKDKGEGLYDIEVVKIMVDENGNDVNIPTVQHSNMTIEQITYHRNECKDRLEEWNDLIKQIEKL